MGVSCGCWSTYAKLTSIVDKSRSSKGEGKGWNWERKGLECLLRTAAATGGNRDTAGTTPRLANADFMCFSQGSCACEQPTSGRWRHSLFHPTADGTVVMALFKLSPCRPLHAK